MTPPYIAVTGAFTFSSYLSIFVGSKADKRRERQRKRTEQKLPSGPLLTPPAVVLEYTIINTAIFSEDLAWWIINQSRTASKVMGLIKEIRRTPTTGTGKPEQLKHKEVGTWSRHVTDADRLVYTIDGNTITLLTCRGHYDDH